MGFIAKDTGGGDYAPVEQGTHKAICNMVVDLGLQSLTWEGKTRPVHQCYVRWELPDERLSWTDDKGQSQEGPMSIGRTYTVSLGPKANLRKDLEAWRGRAFTEEELAGFDLFNLLGKGCLINVTHKTKDGKTYANIANISGLPKGMKVDGPERPIIYYTESEAQMYEQLPEWLRDKIKTAVPASQADANAPAGPGDYGARGPDDLDDDIPF